MRGVILASPCSTTLPTLRNPCISRKKGFKEKERPLRKISSQERERERERSSLPSEKSFIKRERLPIPRANKNVRNVFFSRRKNSKRSLLRRGRFQKRFLLKKKDFRNIFSQVRERERDFKKKFLLKGEISERRENFFWNKKRY